MLIEISDNVIMQSGLSKSEILLEVALSLYQRGVISLGLAAQMAGLHRHAFQLEMSKRNIPVNLSWEDVKKDVADIQAVKSTAK
jgi:predicted HTH domain antitoxin